MSDHITLDQLRARHSWEVIERVRRAKKDSVAADFARQAKRLPIRIRTAGLGQALAFLYGKSDSSGKDGKGQLLCSLADWLLQQRSLAPWRKGSICRNAVIHAVMDGNADLLRRCTEESLLYLQWLTRFAEAELGGGDIDE